MKKLLLTGLVLLTCSVAFAQWGEDELSEEASFKDRIFTGGGFGLSFSSYSDNISVSPLIGYRFTNRLAGGIQLQYQYNKYKEVTPKISTNDYGASIFGRYNFYGPLFVHAEYEYLNYVYAIDTDKKKLRDSYNSFLAGGGFFQPLGSKAGFYLLALYNFSYESPYSGEVTPYNSPWVIRAGVTAGF
ncbi:MAG TPA: hypothetical protein VD884_22520 [Ohtaekwangia sp.]|nr:hypothetical protein [Ohtaekwangia sp.]